MAEDSATLPHAELAARAGIRIRAAEPDDIGDIHDTMSEPGVVGGTLQVPYTALSLRKERLRFADPHMVFLVAESLEDGTGVGNIGIHRVNRPRRIHCADLGMSVRTEWQGRGVGSALMSAVLDVADNWWQVKRVTLEVFADNVPAIALYRRFGFEVEGTLVKDAFRNGQYCDTLTMARLRF
jgi:putative acetyltransferase